MHIGGASKESEGTDTIVDGRLRMTWHDLVVTKLKAWSGKKYRFDRCIPGA